MPGESSERRLPHIFVRAAARAEPYKRRPAGGGGGDPVAQPPDHVAHGLKLRGELDKAIEDARRLREASGIQIEGARPGLYVTIDAPPNVPILNDALISTAKKDLPIEILNLTKVGDVERATLALSDKGEERLAKRLDEYATSPKEKPKGADLVNRMTALQLSPLRDLWTDSTAFPAENSTTWWEVWLRRQDGNEIARFRRLAELASLVVSRRELRFPDRVVLLCRATPASLSRAIHVTTDLAEVRLARESALSVITLPQTDQAALMGDLVDRLRPAEGGAPYVCLMDTGVNRGHPLLRDSLAEADMHACEPEWGNADAAGHGTEQAGIALYGDLYRALSTGDVVELSHRLESVKILPGVLGAAYGDASPTFHGAITAEGVGRVEVTAPARRRAFCLASTLPGASVRGRPTSWSSAVDALAAGRSFVPRDDGLQYLDAAQEDSPRRLFVLSAGDVREADWARGHLDVSDALPVEDPGQAWNALTVGASTELVDPGEDHEGWFPIAPAGDLSPFSRTSVAFDREWPLKPDLVVEGGNLAGSPDGRLEPTDALALLTTYRLLTVRLFTTTWATSPAAARVAEMAASISATHASLWPETVRALLVHSAEWTPRMRDALRGAKRVTEKEAFLRRYGYGVPSLERALYSAKNALTLVVEDTIHPFAKGEMREMHVHALPWPTEALQSMGAADVRLRVTLSYFVEPNPRSPGWTRRDRYASHGLRFDLSRPADSLDAFRKRLNQLALAEEEKGPANRQEPGWVLGNFAREKGSLHADVWEGSAAELASRGYVAVFPVTGWWKEQPARDRSDLGARYALVVSIEAPGVDVDIWTPVSQLVGVTT